MVCGKAPVQLIPCVYCGPRPETEFKFDGEHRPPRPDALAADDRAWADHLYFRTNAKGRSRERWVHSGGCGQWLIIDRDTATHEVFGASLPGSDHAPAEREGA